MVVKIVSSFLRMEKFVNNDNFSKKLAENAY